MIGNETLINVLNYESVVVIPSNTILVGIQIEAGTLEKPSITPVSYIDLKTLNSKSDLISTGRIRFESDIEEKIYNELQITDRENILTDRMIRKLLLDNSIENLKRIGDFKSLQLVSRIKKYLLNMGVSGETIPNQVVSVLNERYDELRYDYKNENSSLNKLLKSENEEVEKSKLQNSVDEMMENQKLMMEELRKLKEENENLKSKDVVGIKETKDVVVDSKTSKVSTAKTK